MTLAIFSLGFLLFGYNLGRLTEDYLLARNPCRVCGKR